MDISLNQRTHIHKHPFNGPFSGTTQVSRYQEGETNLDFTEERDLSGRGISRVTCKSAPRCRQISTPTPHHSGFLQAGCPSCRPCNQQRQSTEGKITECMLLYTHITRNVCLLVLFTNPHPESGSQFHKKSTQSRNRAELWITPKWPTQGSDTYVRAKTLLRI